MSILAEINNDTLSVFSERHSDKLALLWALEKNNIKVIGVALRMLSDEWEHDFIVFVTRENHEYIVEYWEPEVIEILKQYLLKFDIDVDKEIEKAKYKDVVIYPPILKGKKLYRLSLGYLIKTLLTFYLPYKSLGRLSAVVEKYKFLT